MERPGVETPGLKSRVTPPRTKTALPPERSCGTINVWRVGVYRSVLHQFLISRAEWTAQRYHPVFAIPKIPTIGCPVWDAVYSLIQLMPGPWGIEERRFLSEGQASGLLSQSVSSADDDRQKTDPTVQMRLTNLSGGCPYCLGLSDSSTQAAWFFSQLPFTSPRPPGAIAAPVGGRS
jgi:hypothetical protein